MNRRNFIKYLGASAIGSTLGGMPTRSLGMKITKRKPNIVLIFIDDMGWKDTGYNGSDLYETPNLDRLARRGMTFTNAYASAGNCAPSRACLISGQYTPRHHVYAVSSTKRGPVPHMRLEPIPNRRDLDPANLTLAEALQRSGYATAIFGKWHLGNTEQTQPHSQGFEHDISFSPPITAWFKKNNDPKGIYKISQEACRFIEKNKDRPFFAYLSHHATHMGIQARKEMLDKFAAKGPGKLHTDTKFAAMNAQMDDGVGLVLQKIKELGLEENTLVLFTADNGGLPRSPQTPLRGFKGDYYEGGIRVPMTARWPGTIPPGSRCDLPVSNVDFYPTFLDLAAAPTPQDKILDGESLLPLFRGAKKLNRSAIFWHFPGYLNTANPGSRDHIFRTRPVTVIRKGDWKLHLFHEEWVLDGGREKRDTNNALELYNLTGDISESNNLALTRKDKRDELLNDLLNWIKKTNAPLPSQPNPEYNPNKTTRKKPRKKRTTKKP